MREGVGEREREGRERGREEREGREGEKRKGKEGREGERERGRGEQVFSQVNVILGVIHTPPPPHTHTSHTLHLPTHTSHTLQNSGYWTNYQLPHLWKGFSLCPPSWELEHWYLVTLGCLC